MARKRLPLPTEAFEARIERLDPRGRGVARVDERPVHIPNALPGERVRFRYLRRARRSDDGLIECILDADPDRVEPRCAFADTCGGCRTQHVDPTRALAQQQARWLEALAAVEVVPEHVAPPIEGPRWGYRRRARLAARLVPKKGGVLVGFREKVGGYVAEMTRCEVLDERVGPHIGELRELLSGMSIAAQLPQIEVAAGDSDATLVFRHLEPLSSDDRARLARFGRDSGLRIALQPGGLDSVHPLDAGGSLMLHYDLDAFDVRVHFLPTDFIQVNGVVNEAMVARAIEWLEPRPGEPVADLFCGLGNFTLPIARSGAEVHGFEGDPNLVERARANAHANGLEEVEFTSVDLFEPSSVDAVLDRGASKVLLDSPRSGAEAVCASLLGRASEGRPVPRRLVYVSCGPSTFVRDAEVLRSAGYRLVQAGVIDMFPHTGHIETIGQFER